jgi:hypothetical protein
MLYSYCLKALLASALLGSSIPPAMSQTAERARDYVAMVDAENGKSATCRAYEGKVIAPVAFDTLAARLKGPAPKGEYETTQQHRARLAVSKPGGGLAVVSVPLNREFLRYDADAGAILVMAGAFKTGEYGEAVQANIGAEIAMMSAKASVGEGARFTIGLPGSERTVSTSTARNIIGTTIRTAEVCRTTRALSLSGGQLIAFARGQDAVVTGVEAPIAKAPAMKAALRAAVVIEPQAPFVVGTQMPGAAATSSQPIHYTELSTIIVGRARCALILNAQSRVVASVDAGSKADGQ